MYRVVVVGLAVVIACATAGRDNHSDAIVGDGKLDAFQFLDANNCATQPCDIPTQCGCGSGACDIDHSDFVGTACRMITTPGHETSTCVGAADCDKDYVCLGGPGDSSCHKYCATNADCGTPRGLCAIDIQSGGSAIPGIPPACSSNCDPTNSASPAVCPSTMKCSMFTAMHLGSAINISDCEKAGLGTQGSNCKVGTNGDDTMCAPNFMCTTINAGANYNCRRICGRAPAGGQCGGLTCIAFASPLSIGGTEYGVCN